VPAAGRGMALAQPGRNRKAEIAPSAAPKARGTGLPVGANDVSATTRAPMPKPAAGHDASDAQVQRQKLESLAFESSPTRSRSGSRRFRGRAG
jgi:hypothetical protein